MYQQITHVKTELCRYRKGSLAVSIDMDRGLLKWKDSNHWNNDFTRSISKTDLQRIREELASMQIIQWQETFPVTPEEGHCRYSWTIAIDMGDNRLMHSGSDQFPAQWNDFRSLIESISRTTFDL